MENSIFKIREKIEEKERIKKLPPFFNEGKMGLSLYFFRLARLTNNECYNDFAEDLVVEVCGEIGKNYLSISPIELIINTIAIDYLINNGYVSGDINDVVHEIDVFVYREFLKQVEQLSKQDLLIALYYFCIRLNKQEDGTDESFIFKELIIHSFNRLLYPIDEELLTEPPYYSIYYKLPQFIYLMSKIYSLGFYNYKVDSILKERLSLITSRFPILHAHRLYLLWSIINIKTEMNSSIWDDHIKLLCENIDINRIVTKELLNKDLYIEDGVSSIYLLCTEINRMSNKTLFDTDLLCDKIAKSDIWKDSLWDKESLSFLSGLTGLILIIESVKNS